MKTLFLAALLAPGLLLAGCGKAPAVPKASAPAKVEDPRATAEYRQCFKRANYVDFEIRVCEYQALEGQDARLNAAYRAVLARIDVAEERTALIAAEKAWIAYRDTQCEYQGARFEGGTLQPVEIARCQVDLTVERVRFFQGVLNNPY